ncbi:helix-turn-helix transcriptional regulator [Exiguobacterium sp. s127]|uniref:helix-turn-helix domain-containing protein n=1 Tax=Exiguobacterium sp. s127 TaxID=2751210 RepID=UPI001BEA68F6|nr:helix-turn-helix transcriptional regulator [Exiguobacterium sp. s127]
MNQDLLKKMMADRIKTCRKNHIPKMTQTELAKTLGVDKALMSKYENPKYPDMPPHRVLNQIGDIFEVSLDYLNGRVDDPHITLSEYIEQASRANKMIGMSFTEEELQSLDQQKIDKIIQYMRDQVNLAMTESSFKSNSTEK